MTPVWTPSPAQIESTNVVRFMQRLGFADRTAFLQFSTEHLEEFWAETAREVGVRWRSDYQTVLDTSQGVEWARWFSGGTLNLAENCLDRWQNSEAVAVAWQNEAGLRREISYRALCRRANQIANWLLAEGIAVGDRIALCIPMEAELAALLYGCWKVGAVVVPVFSGFGPAAIAARIEDSGARVVFTARTLVRRGRELALREKVDAALASSGPVRVVELSELSRALDGMAEAFETRAMDASAPALILYTSGTTGRPKGCVHTHIGALLQPAKEILLAFDARREDRFLWLSDIGWMMGPWAVIGTHNAGATLVLYDGAPDWPTPDRLWRLLAEERVTTFGVSPTAIRLLRDKTDPRTFSLDSLRLLGSTGEPWDESAWLWFFHQVGGGRCPIINISGGTEILGCFLLPLPIQPLVPCTLGGPGPGMATEVVDEHGERVRGRTGYLVCTKPAPSFTSGLWGDPARYLETYWARFPGWWFHGDWASVDADGFWFLHGRADESMNVAGRKIGPGEVEQILCSHGAVAEAAVVGVPDAIKGEDIVAFAVLRAPAAVSPEELKSYVAAQMGTTFRPRIVVEVPELPKTQSGKIVRRLLRQKYLGEPLGDISTVANPRSLEFSL